MASAQIARAVVGQDAKGRLLAALRAKRPQRASREVEVDPDAVRGLAEAQQRHDQAVLLGQPTVELLAKALEAAKVAAEGAVVTVHFQGLPRAVFDAVVSDHPPDEADAAKGHAYDAETFLPAIMAATIVGDDEAPVPTLQAYRALTDGEVLAGRLFTAAEVLDLTDPWNPAEYLALASAAMGVCQQTRNEALPFGSVRTGG